MRVGLKKKDGKKKKCMLNMVCSQSIVNQQGRIELALQNDAVCLLPKLEESLRHIARLSGHLCIQWQVYSKNFVSV